jgi:hypothetical protein
MNNELKGMWEEMVLVSVEVLSWHVPKELMKTVKNLRMVSF